MRLTFSKFISLVSCASVWSCGSLAKQEPDAPNGDVDAAGPDADPCTGVCECRVDADCASIAHRACDDQGTSRTCSCVAGFSLQGGKCEWTGVIADPGFASTTRWASTSAMNLINVNLNEVGMIEAGAAVLPGEEVCRLSRLTQLTKMPRFSLSGPLVAEISYKGDGQFMAPTSPAYGTKSVWQSPPPSTAYRTARQCLGAGFYADETSKGLGVETTIELMPDSLPNSCPRATGGLTIDRFEIKPANAGECPNPGLVLNGDAEAAGGWTFDGGGSGTTSTAIEPGIGEGNTSAVRLFATNRCAGLRAETFASVPVNSQIASPAISFFSKTTATVAGAAESRFQLAETDLTADSAQLAPGVGKIEKLCVAAPFRGTVAVFQARLQSFGTCAEVINSAAIYDNVKFINEPSCGTDPNVANPGFEATASLFGASFQPGRSLARSLNDPAKAHSGNSSLQLSASFLCSGPEVTVPVVVPSAMGAQGPALTFFYKGKVGSYRLRVEASGDPATLSLDDTYRQGTLCLDPRLHGRKSDVVFSLAGGSGTCASSIPTEEAFVDDLAVTTSPRCPAQ